VDQIKQKIMIQYSLVFLLLIISARASFFFNLRIFPVLLFFSSLFYFLYKGNKFDKKLIIINSIAIVWIIAIYIKFNIPLSDLDSAYTYTGFLVLINTTYFLVISIENYFEKIVKIVLLLSVISIFGFIFQLILPKLTFEVNSLLTDNIPVLKYGGDTFSNSIIFTFYKQHEFRNSGFSWEPGAFGSFLDITLALSLIISKYKISYKHIIFIIAIITTFSATAYAGLLVIITLYLYNLNFRKALLAFFLLIPLTIYVAQLDIIGGKFKTYFTSDIIQLNEGLGTSGSDYSYTTNRFASFILDIEDLSADPLLGRGINDKTRYYGHLNVKRSNGLSDLILKLGLILFSLFSFGLYKSSSILFKEKELKGPLIFVALIFTVAFAEPILYTLFVFSISFYHLGLKGENA